MMMLMDEEEKHIAKAISDYMGVWINKSQSNAFDEGCVIWFICDMPTHVEEYATGWVDFWYDFPVYIDNQGLSQMLIGFRSTQDAMMWKLKHLEDFSD